MKNLIFIWFIMSAIRAYGQDTTLSQQMFSQISKIIEDLCNKKDFCFVQKESLSLSVKSNWHTKTETSQSEILIGYQDMQYAFAWPQFSPHPLLSKSKCMTSFMEVYTPPSAHTNLDSMIYFVLMKCQNISFKDFD